MLSKTADFEMLVSFGLVWIILRSNQK